MKRTLFIVLSVVAVFLILGISLSNMSTRQNGAFLSKTSPHLGFGGGGGAPEGEALPPAPAAEPGQRALDSSSSGVTNAYDSAGQPAQPQERLVIETAVLTIVVKDPAARQAEISTLAKEFGGYVVSSDLSQASGAVKEVLQATIHIRVPSERLDEALEKIKEGAVDVPYEKRTGEDVTNQYVDLQAQLRAKQAAEKKLLEIMDQATRAEDVLAIYLQVQNVQTQIEQLKGQIQYYEEAAAMSSIAVTLQAEESVQPLQVGPWKPQGAVKQAIEDLIVFFQNFVDFLIYFVLSTLPKLILIAIPLYLVYLLGRAVYRRFNKPRADVKEIKE